MANVNLQNIPTLTLLTDLQRDLHCPSGILVYDPFNGNHAEATVDQIVDELIRREKAGA